MFIREKACILLAAVGGQLEMSQSHNVLGQTRQLRTGCALKHSICDGDGTLLLSAGAVITDRFKQQLLERGVEEVALHADDAAHLQVDVNAPSQDATGSTQGPPTTLPNASDDSVRSKLASLSSTVKVTVENSQPPMRDSFVPIGCVPYDAERDAFLASQFDSAARLLEDTIDSILDGGQLEANELAGVASKYSKEMAKDIDHVVASGSELSREPIVTKRSIQMAILSMIMGIDLGFDEQNLHELGTCALVHDWGLYDLDPKLRDPSAPLESEDRELFRTHPLRTVAMLDRVEGISDAVKLAASQVHEEVDGSGYPRGLRKPEIHPFARIVNVADAYVCLTTQLRGRPAIIPYYVMVYLLKHVKDSRFDSNVVRALLRSLSLFPIGSHVRLSDKSTATVLRKNAEDYMQPIVRGVSAKNTRIDTPHDPGAIIDLSKDHRTIVEALPNPNRRDIPLDRKLMDQVS